MIDLFKKGSHSSFLRFNFCCFFTQYSLLSSAQLINEG
jgi:hypothetical protein